MNTNHTPTPWMLDATPAVAPCSFIIRGKAEKCDAWVPVAHVAAGMNQAANSEFIVRVANSHDELLDALDRIASGQWPNSIAETEGTLALREVARAAIAKARGQTDWQAEAEHHEARCRLLPAVLDAAIAHEQSKAITIPTNHGESNAAYRQADAHAKADRMDADWKKQCADARAVADRIESERPADGIPIPSTSSLCLAAYRMPNGSKFVTLVDDTDATWEAYCREVAKKNWDGHNQCKRSIEAEKEAV